MMGNFSDNTSYLTPTLFNMEVERAKQALTLSVDEPFVQYFSYKLFGYEFSYN